MVQRWHHRRDVVFRIGGLVYDTDVGYPEQHRMLKLIKRTYWWPELKENVKKYVQEYFKY